MSRFLCIFFATSVLVAVMSTTEAAPTDDSSSNIFDMLDIAGKVLTMQNPHMGKVIRKVRSTIENVNINSLKERCLSMDQLMECASSLKDNVGDIVEVAQMLQDFF